MVVAIYLQDNHEKDKNTNERQLARCSTLGASYSIKLLK